MTDVRTKTRSDGVRASDAERDRVIELLREHAVAGRLTPEELEGRIDEVYAARTRAELEPPLRELPAGPASPMPRTMRTPRARPRLRLPLAPVIGLLVLLNVVTGVGFVWLALIPLFATGVLAKPRHGGCARPSRTSAATGLRRPGGRERGLRGADS